jgi:hypothetical protein
MDPFSIYSIKVFLNWSKHVTGRFYIFLTVEVTGYIMTKQQTLALLLILLVFVILAVALIIGAVYYNWFGSRINRYARHGESGVTYSYLETDASSDTYALEDLLDRKEKDESTSSDNTSRTSANNNTSRTKSVSDRKTFSNKGKKRTSDTRGSSDASTITRKNSHEGISSGPEEEVSKHKTFNSSVKGVTSEERKTYSKGSSLPDQDFDSYGEYVSAEEYQYRISLIQGLTIKTVVINRLTAGNGVSQEFFRVVYINKMIPARILEEIVESKEFRNLIPRRFLTDEVRTRGLGDNNSIRFENEDIRQLLLLWSLGRLTPFDKAWRVKAET